MEEVILETKYQHKLFVLMAQKNIRKMTDLAKMADVDYKKLQLFSNYKQKYIDPEFLAALCEVLDCEIGDLLTIKR